MITELIDKVDTVEVVRDQIVAILVLETAAQKALATAASEDPRLWELRVFLERLNPWANFIDAPEQIDGHPIVNVSVETENFEERASDVVARQKAEAVFTIDVFGYGISEDDGGAGHIPGDMRAALEVQRAVRLVRNILMAGAYTYLGLRGTVWRRWIQSIRYHKPSIDDRTVPQIAAARIAFAVEFSEFSPQVLGQTLELISGTVFRAETGEVLLQADHEIGA